MHAVGRLILAPPASVNAAQLTPAVEQQILVQMVFASVVHLMLVVFQARHAALDHVNVEHLQAAQG